MSPERKTNIKYGCVLVLMACIGTAFVMDANYRNSPRIPDVASGRIYDHQLKGIGTVYLTESEERPYRLLFWIGGVSLVIWLGMQAADVVADRRKRP